MAKEIFLVSISQGYGDDIVFNTDEHPRMSSLETLAKLPTPFRKNGIVTAGNTSGVNDGAAAMLIASEDAVGKYGLHSIALGHPLEMSGLGLLEPPLMN